LAGKEKMTGGYMTDITNQEARHKNCSICSQLKDYEYAIQTHGREEQDTFLPKIGEQLKHIREVKPTRGRYMALVRCPECGTYYTSGNDYEYLATGSEDEQFRYRITDEEAEKLLAQPLVK
jgi:hypothetical protein